MLDMRKFKPGDSEAVVAFLRRLKLSAASHPLDHFWVALEGGTIVAALRLEVFDDFAFLSHLGVAEECRGNHLGASLMERSFQGLSKPIYLYTIIPDYFIRHGFREALARPDLPPRELFGCDRCEPGKCVCMKREHHDT